MPNPLVECIPNFSEARRPEVVKAILDIIQNTEGVQILDHSSDSDHNRTVVTFVGIPDAVEEAAFQAIKMASQLIDLNQHTGEHPRIGATDVVPFVPIRDIGMDECVIMAKHLGKRVADELNIPVYLYEDAAINPLRKDLEVIRRGQYEGLKKEILTNPEKKPDFGPNELGSAGATVIGARQPLIAFNVYLTTDDVAIAQKIALALRHSSGGYHFIKAMGVLVEGRAQVSMNFTNFHKSPIGRVVETIRREALRYGTAVHHSELVGMIPQEALIDSAVWYLQLDQFQPEQILEQKLTELELICQPGSEESSFLKNLASASPTPGGGSAGAYTGAAAAALVAMVARLTIGRKKYADVEDQMLLVLDQAENLRKGLEEAVILDSEAFEEYMLAMKLPKNSAEEIAIRNSVMEKATLRAARVPLGVVKNAVKVVELAIEVAAKGNINAISDAGSAAALARSALASAGMNVQINLLNLQQSVEARDMLEQLDLANKLAEQLLQTMRDALLERGKIQFGI